jgi:hypothetical protein
MSKLARRRNLLPKKDGRASKDRGKAVNEKQSQVEKDHLLEAEAIERAVYDGMQDLRAKKSS